MSARRLGVFGGTFDPPHVGHLIVAHDAADELALDRVLMMVSARPPHRSAADPSPAPLRLEMLEAAVADDPVLEASDLELHRPGPSYTADTLAELRRRHADDELLLLIGVDQWRQLGSWKDPHRLAGLATIAVMARAGETPTDNGLGLAWRSCTVTRVDVSATEIRERVRRGRSIHALVPAPVRAIIEGNGLYRAPEPVADPAERETPTAHEIQ